MWHYQRECSPNAGNPRILLQHEAFGLRASPHTVYSCDGGSSAVASERFGVTVMMRPGLSVLLMQ
jgi:hypothetical protein